jgi:hypothetical protein
MKLEITPSDLHELGPDLVLVTSHHPATGREMDHARATIPAQLRIAFFDFDRETYWLREPVKDAERLRVLLAGPAKLSPVSETGYQREPARPMLP